MDSYRNHPARFSNKSLHNSSGSKEKYQSKFSLPSIDIDKKGLQDNERRYSNNLVPLPQVISYKNINDRENYIRSSIGNLSSKSNLNKSPKITSVYSSHQKLSKKKIKSLESIYGSRGRNCKSNTQSQQSLHPVSNRYSQNPYEFFQEQRQNFQLNKFIQQNSNSLLVQKYIQEKLQIDRKMFVNLKVGNIKDNYHFDKRVGQGTFGVVYQATNRLTLQKVAIKAIVYSDLTNHKQFINECNIMIKLDHPNIANIFEIWEWDNLLFLVMDFYEGGELYEYLKRRGYLEEFEVFKVMKQMVSVLIYMQENNISHKDLKLENFLLKEKDDLSNIKVADFGLSQDLSHQQIMLHAAGTPFYVAPETLLSQGTIKSDIWSLGVIMYVLMTGRMPFQGQNSLQILNNVLKQEINFNHPSFVHVSQEAKDLISQMLNRNIDERINANQILQHPWYLFFSENELTFSGPKEVKEKREVNSSQHKKTLFDGMSLNDDKNLNKMVMVYLATNLEENLYKKLRISFIEMDLNKNGTISTDELQNFFRDQKEDKILHLFDKLDLNKNGVLDYREFLAANLRKLIRDKILEMSGLDKERLKKEKSKENISNHLVNAFQFFDTDKNGFISKSNLISFLDQRAMDFSPEEISSSILGELDKNMDGQIDLAEFLSTLIVQTKQDFKIIEYFNQKFDL